MESNIKLDVDEVKTYIWLNSLIKRAINEKWLSIVIKAGLPSGICSINNRIISKLLEEYGETFYSIIKLESKIEILFDKQKQYKEKMNVYCAGYEIEYKK